MIVEELKNYIKNLFSFPKYDKEELKNYVMDENEKLDAEWTCRPLFPQRKKIEDIKEE